MSALFGIINHDGQPVAQDQLAAMAAALAQLGADGGGLWALGGAGLGMRLMAFTPEDRLERQPRLAAGQGSALVFDGRLDNREELAAKLGMTALDRPDSELVEAAYQRWGEACLPQLAGVFALARWDGPAQTLFLARSPILAPPIFYYSSPGWCAFATMPRGLFALPGIPRALNEQKFADMLIHSPADPEATLYRGIARLATGSQLSLCRGQGRARAFWQADQVRELRFRRDQDYIDGFHELAAEVVRNQLRSSTPVGVMLSGGLDSATVAVLAARQLAVQGRRLSAYTEVPRFGFDGPVPPGRYPDEGSRVTALAAGVSNLDLNLIRTGQACFLDRIDWRFPHLERPVNTMVNLVWMEAILAASAEKGARVLLMGAQGNLTISRGGPGRLARLRSLLPGPLGRALAGLGGQGDRAILADSPIHPGFAAHHRVLARARAAREGLHRPGAHSRLLAGQALMLQDLGLLETPLRGMLGVELRSPTADIRLAEFGLSLPDEQLQRPGEPRSFLRRAMRGQLPPELLGNRLRGQQAADWFERLALVRHSLPAELERLEACGSARRILDLGRMRALLEAWPQARPEPQWLAQVQRVLERGLVVGRFLLWFEQGG